MRVLTRSCLIPFAALSLSLSAWIGSASAADETKSDRVTFPACDGVELSGTFYPSLGRNKDAVVLFLHDFEPRKGGGSHGDWDKLAARLQKEGYAVLSFDFRGFGGSTSVRDEFWRLRYNQQGIPKGYRNGKPSETIDQKDFLSSYYPALINDVAAARAFLDRKNDSREVNTSNLIVIGAGAGATLGALWVSAEMHRQKDTSPPMLIPPAVPLRMDDPEGKDIAAAIWLSISPTLANRKVSGAVKSALIDAARDNRVPTVLVVGEKDKSGGNVAKDYKDAIEGARKSSLKNTGTKTINGTELTGSKLLSGRLETVNWIPKYLNNVMEDRGSKEWKMREEEKARYFWTRSGRPVQLAKNAGEKVIRPIPPAMLKLN